MKKINIVNYLFLLVGISLWPAYLITVENSDTTIAVQLSDGKKKISQELLYNFSGTFKDWYQDNQKNKKDGEELIFHCPQCSISDFDFWLLGLENSKIRAMSFDELNKVFAVANYLEDSRSIQTTVEHLANRLGTVQELSIYNEDPDEYVKKLNIAPTMSTLLVRKLLSPIINPTINIHFPFPFPTYSSSTDQAQQFLVADSDDSRHLYVYTLAGEGFRCEKEIAIHDCTRFMSVNSVGNLIMHIDTDGFMQIIDIQTDVGHHTHSFSGSRPHQFIHGCWHSHQDRVAGLEKEGYIVLFDPNNTQYYQEYILNKEDKNFYSCIAWGDDNLFIGRNDGSIECWAIHSNEERRFLNKISSFQVKDTSAITAMHTVYINQKSWLLIACADGSFYISNPKGTSISPLGMIHLKQSFTIGPLTIGDQDVVNSIKSDQVHQVIFIATQQGLVYPMPFKELENRINLYEEQNSLTLTQALRLAYESQVTKKSIDTTYGFLRKQTMKQYRRKAACMFIAGAVALGCYIIVPSLFAKSLLDN